MKTVHIANFGALEDLMRGALDYCRLFDSKFNLNIEDIDLNGFILELDRFTQTIANCYKIQFQPFTLDLTLEEIVSTLENRLFILTILNSYSN